MHQSKQHPMQHAMDYAGFWRRAAAAGIDCFVAIACSSLITVGSVLLRHGSITVEHVYGIGLLIGFPLTWLYFAGFECSRYQATPGKIALALQVTDLVGARVGFARATGRFFGKYVLFSLLSFPILLPNHPVTEIFPQFLFIVLMLSSVWSPALPQLLAVLFIATFIIAAFTRRKQGLHDMMANCLVLHKPSPATGVNTPPTPS